MPLAMPLFDNGIKPYISMIDIRKIRLISLRQAEEKGLPTSVCARSGVGKGRRRSWT